MAQSTVDTSEIKEKHQRNIADYVGDMTALEAHIETRRDQLNQSLSALQRTHANAESALDSAALCDEVPRSHFGGVSAPE